jgi:hypothetical protein
MNLFTASTTPNSFQPGASIRRACGIVQHVDLVSRELRVDIAARSALVDVPAGCPIVLHGERIKLRMVQPGDVALITFTKSRGLWVARLVELQPQAPAG